MTEKANYLSRHLVGLVALTFCLLPVAAEARKQPATPEPAAPATARMVVEKQLEAHDTNTGVRLNSAEVKRIQDRYLNRIGVLLEVENNSDTGRSGGR
jgi:hypothetical protein